MPFWPFKRREPEALSPTEIRDRLIGAAGSGDHRRLLAACQQYKAQVAANVGLMCKVPEEIRKDEAALNGYVQCLGAVAQCLAQECGAPDLWNGLCGTPQSNPLLVWEAWFAALPERAGRLEHAALIEEARQFIAEAKRMEGRAARQGEVYFQGRVGELLFHSGKVADSIDPWLAALNLCREQGDVEGQRVYLNNLLEAHRYLGRNDDGIRFGEEAIALAVEHNLDCEATRKFVRRIRLGEPLCRVVLSESGNEIELEEVAPQSEGRYQFAFRRNRLSLQVAIVRTRRGNELASSGNLADALEQYRAASEVDPHDPDPVYQTGMCLLEMGLYARAGEAFDEVERLAPGWFRCRFDRWLARSLEAGDVSDDEFRLVRLLEDGGLPPDKAEPVVRKAVADFPHFAPLYLFLGDVRRDVGDTDWAVAAYRDGLELASEPDLESRLLCALAGLLPVDSPERNQLVERAAGLEGSLVARAMTAVIPTR
jgi:tetratricopeptide (TPR) repeat protein